MAYEKSPMVKVFSLWETRKEREDGTKIRFWSGIVGGTKYLMFRSKSNHPQAPMFDVFITPFQRNKDRAQSTASPKDESDDFRAEPNDKPATQEAEASDSDQNEELPF